MAIGGISASLSSNWTYSIPKRTYHVRLILHLADEGLVPGYAYDVRLGHTNDTLVRMRISPQRGESPNNGLLYVCSRSCRDSIL